MNRIDGQIWIDRNRPHRLKYHIDGIDYVVEVAAAYYYDTTLGDLPAGTLVKLVGENQVEPAIFPQDIDNILGIAQTSAKANQGEASISVSRSGYLVLLEEDIKEAFWNEEDLNLTTNKWDNKTIGIGAPVYWFIGRTKKNGNNWEYYNSADYPGKLTLSTPAGYRWNVTSDNFTDDDSLNITYDNLPQIGNVARYSVSEDGTKVISMSIHMNFSSFDSSLEWSYPAYHKGETALHSDKDFRHGLFPNTEDLMVSDVHIKAATTNPHQSLPLTLLAPTEDYFTGDKRTKIIMNIPPEENYLFRVSGEVRYNLDEGHN